MNPMDLDGHYTLAGVGFFSAFIFAISAAHGYRSVSACQEALEESAGTS
jgi:hypothetical protein